MTVGVIVMSVGMIVLMVTTVLFIASLVAVLVARVTAGGHKEPVQVLHISEILIFYVKMFKYYLFVY